MFTFVWELQFYFTHAHLRPRLLRQFLHTVDNTGFIPHKTTKQDKIFSLPHISFTHFYHYDHTLARTREWHIISGSSVFPLKTWILIYDSNTVYTKSFYITFQRCKKIIKWWKQKSIYPVVFVNVSDSTPGKTTHEQTFVISHTHTIYRCMIDYQSLSVAGMFDTEQ